MQRTSPPAAPYILCLSVFLALFRFSAYSFKYIPYLDDYVQYFYYPAFDNPWQSILLGGPGVLFSRPLAGIFDRFFWSLFAGNLAVAQIIISVLYGVSGVLFFKTLDILGFCPSPLFLAVYLLTPVNTEGTYWLSASSRIVISMLLIAAAVYALAKNKGLTFAVLQFLSVWFYEQTAVLSVFFSTIICILTKQYKKIVFPLLSASVFVLFYLFCGKLGDNAERLVAVSGGSFFDQALGMFSQLYNVLFPLSLRLTARGFFRGLGFIISRELRVWLLLLLILSGLFFAAFKKFTPDRLPKRAVLGVLLTLVPFLPFFVSRDASLNFRNIVPALLGIALLLDGLIMRLFRKFAPLAGAVLVVVFSVASLAEMTDYNLTAAADLKLAQEIAAALPLDAQSVTCKISAPDYYPQSAPFGDHIKSMIASDWGVTGIVRTLTGNRELTVTLIK